MGTTPRGPSMRHGPEDRLRLPLDRPRQRASSRPESASASLRRGHPDEARPAAGQGDEGEGALTGVELGRGLPVLAVMGQDRRQRGLRVGPGPRRDAGGLPQGRAAAVGRDDEARRDSDPSASVRMRGVPVDRRRPTVPSTRRSAAASARRGGQPVDEGGVLDVPAEGVEIDLAGMERHRRRPEEAAGIVDDPHGLEGRGVRARPRPRRRAPSGTVPSRRGGRRCVRRGARPPARRGRCETPPARRRGRP